MKCPSVWATGRLSKAPENIAVRDMYSFAIFSLILTYHRLSFLVKDGYFVLARASTGGKYFGSTCCVKMSGLMITKDRPCGSQDMISESEESLKISISFSGKISRFLVVALVSDFRLRLSSSSLTTAGVETVVAIACVLESTSAVSAVAASTRCERPFIPGRNALIIVVIVNLSPLLSRC